MTLLVDVKKLNMHIYRIWLYMNAFIVTIRRMEEYSILLIDHLYRWEVRYNSYCETFSNFLKCIEIIELAIVY